MNKVINWIKKFDTQTLFFIAAIVFLSIFVYLYSDSKSNINEGLSHALSPSSIGDSFSPILTSNNDTNYAMPASGSIPQSSSPTIDPSELLPKDGNSEWNKLNPVSTANVNGNVVPGPHQYTVSSVPNRNPNLQLRSDIPIPQATVGPWNNTTILPDDTRRPLDIGPCK
jgi:hypothetical protein